MTTPPDDIKAWRAALRKQLLAKRLMVSDADRKRWNAAITQYLIDGFPQLPGMSIGSYWPYQGEFDPRFAVYHFMDRGASAAQPEVVAKGQPLRFRAWWPGVAMTIGAYDIPIADGADAAGVRLGYGAGFYDRTLATSSPRPLTIAVAYELSRVDTIHPHAFDLAMDYVVTERGIFPTQTPSAT